MVGFVLFETMDSGFCCSFCLFQSCKNSLCFVAEALEFIFSIELCFVFLIFFSEIAEEVQVPKWMCGVRGGQRGNQDGWQYRV